MITPPTRLRHNLSPHLSRCCDVFPFLDFVILCVSVPSLRSRLPPPIFLCVATLSSFVFSTPVSVSSRFRLNFRLFQCGVATLCSFSRPRVLCVFVQRVCIYVDRPSDGGVATFISFGLLLFSFNLRSGDSLLLRTRSSPSTASVASISGGAAALFVFLQR